MSNSNRNFNKTGLTFSISDVNFDSNSLDLVPIHLNSPVNEELKHVIDKTLDPLLNFKSTVGSEYHSKINFVDSSPEIQKEVSSNVMFIEQYTNIDESDALEQTFTNFPNNSPSLNRNNLMANSIYEDISYYWFYCVIINGLAEWKPFSIKDSQRIEMKYFEIIENNENKFISIDDCVPTDGGRYDVFINKRQKVSVYWNEAPMEIRRASWFYRPEDESFYIPYSEIECEKLETQFKYVLENNKWNQPFELNVNPNERCLEDRFVFHSPNTMVEYRRYGYISGADNVMKGRVVYRGVEGFKNHLEPGESDNIDHVIFVIHGIGSVCDMAGRGIVECVQIMKNVSGKMLESHFPRHNGRVELLPVSWHSKLHSETSSVDRDLSKISLKSVPKLRNFTNNTLIDVLCYSSPTYCQTILTIVSAEMNRLRHLFVSRNPQYDGVISIVGHSLGAMIAFDLISLQDPESDSVHRVPITDIAAIPRLEFEVGHLFALGSPISLLLTARGLSVLGEDFQLSRCRGFFNIFHPFDPVAYRMEPMLVSECPTVIRPVVIPHHKGRKRLHLELKDNLVRVSQDIKSRLVQTLRNTWTSLQEFATSHAGNIGDELGDHEMIRVLNKIDGSIDDRDDVESAANEMEIVMGQLNGGKRIDYVLQEAPLESFNDYLFALGSHACYWDSEDTVLMMLKEIYVTLNIYPETKPSDSSINIMKHPHSRSVSNTTQLPPIIPLVSSHQTVSNSSLPPTFPTIQNKQYFIPNFNLDQSANEQSDLTLRECQNLEPLSSFSVSEKKSQSTSDLLSTAYELSDTTQENKFNSDCLDPTYQNENSFSGSQFESNNCTENSSLSDIHNKPPFYQYKDNFQPLTVTDKQEPMAFDNNPPLYPPPPVMMPNNATIAFTSSTTSQCYVSSTNHYLLNSSNNLIQKQLLPINLQSSLPTLSTLSKTTFYPSESSSSDIEYQISTQDSFHIPNQLNIETNPPIQSVSVGIQPLSFTNYLSSPPLIEQFQSIISSNSSLSTHLNFQPNDLSTYFQPFSSTLPETVSLNDNQQKFLTDYFNDNQSVMSANQPSEIITSHTTEPSNVFDINPEPDSHFYGFSNTDSNYLALDDSESNRFASSHNANESQQLLSENTLLISETIWKSSSPPFEETVDKSLSGFDHRSVLPYQQHLSQQTGGNISSLDNTKPKLKPNQDFSHGENYSRTPSPRIFSQTPRNSPKSIVSTVPVPGPMFGSKPLMPQSGKLFKKK